MAFSSPKRSPPELWLSKATMERINTKDLNIRTHMLARRLSTRCMILPEQQAASVDDGTSALSQRDVEYLCSDEWGVEDARWSADLYAAAEETASSLHLNNVLKSEEIATESQLQDDAPVWENVWDEAEGSERAAGEEVLFQEAQHNCKLLYILLEEDSAGHSRLLITGFIKEDLPSLPNPCYSQNYDRSMSQLSLVPKDTATLVTV
jgi:hypothetical protein